MLSIPEHLNDRGRDFYREVSREHRIADTSQLALLVTAAECLDRMEAAQEAVRQYGEVVEDRYGAPKLNPALQLEKDARTGFLSAMRALNLQPQKTPGRPAGTWNRAKGVQA